MAASAPDTELLVSTATVGSSNVGKTTLVTALARGSVSSDPAAAPLNTVGVDTQCVRLTADGKHFKHIIFDTAGQERFMAITSTFLRKKHVIIATYSLNDLDSIRKIHELWLPKSLELCRERTLFAFVGNKLDLVPAGKTANDLGAEDAGDGESSTATSAATGDGESSAASTADIGGGRPEMLVEALREMRQSVDKLLAAHPVAPLFFETSAVRGDNLTEFMAEISRTVVRDRLESGRALATGERVEATALDIDPDDSKGILGMGSCCA